MLNNAGYPFAAAVGQKQAKRALLIALVNPKAGGLLIGGCKGTGKSVLARGCRELIAPRLLLDLPLNVTEDMLFGSIDVEYAVTKGERRFAPGILARADGNALYIDEVNLLRPELLTAVLNANAAGFNQVERDGISFRHPVRLTVIGTMNNEEGSLSRSLLERFGMYVDMQEETDVAARVEIIRRALAYASDPGAFRLRYAEQTRELAAQIESAQRLLPTVEVSDAMLVLAAQICTQAMCAGHAAEIYLLEAAKAIAALAARQYVLPKDLEKAAQFVLPHRMRQAPQEQPQEQETPEDGGRDDDKENDDTESENKNNDAPPLPDGQSETEPGGGPKDTGQNDEQQTQQNDGQQAPEEEIADIDKGFCLPKLLVDLGKDRSLRRGSGKRSLTRTDLKQGRYVRAQAPKSRLEDLAFDATIRAAAPFQKWREPNGCAVNVKPEDLRQKVREKRVGNTFLFVVDASGSMGARQRMRAVKGAIFYMLQEAYQKRDRVGMLAFRRQEAQTLLPVTRSVDLAQKCLKEMPTGGKTPLADGLALSLLTLSALGKRDKEMQPILILVTDGRANAAADGGDPVAAALRMAEKIRRAGIVSVVIDTEADFIRLGLARQIAAAMGANYYTLQRLSRDNIIRIVRNLEV